MASDPRTETTARAIVQITVEVESGSNWGPDVQLDQVYRQAAEGAVNQLRYLLKEEIAKGTMRIIGEPEVRQILTQRKKP